MYTRNFIPYGRRDDKAAELLSWARHVVDRRDIRTSVHISTDPATGAVELSLFTDDGEGNGDGIFSIGLQEVVEAIRAYHAKKEG